MKIYLDFDGTVVEHTYPEIGRHNFGCMKIVKKLQEAGHEIILNTYRANLHKDLLQHSIDYVNDSAWIEDEIDDDDLIEIKSTTEKYDPHPWNLKTALERGVMYIDDIAYGSYFSRRFNLY